jgi:hypothetical protein
MLDQLKNSGIIRNPLNPDQIAVADPAPQHINDSPVVATPPPDRLRPKTPGDLAQEMLKKRNEEFNKRFTEELKRQERMFNEKLFNDVVTGTKVVVDPAPDRLRPKTPGDEEFKRHIEELKREKLFTTNDVVGPPSGVEASWRPGVSPPWQKNPEEALDEANKRLEEQRRREAELFERLAQLKSIRLAVPRLIELPEPPLAISPWRWALPRPIVPQPIRPLDEGRRKVPA